jgi:tripartite-type tricarboxylate transporter receptor subunit TctC
MPYPPPRRHRTGRAALARLGVALAAMFALSAQAQNTPASWPVKPIRLIVGIAAGSVTDVVARAMGEELPRRLGQPLVIENRPGGNMVIAAEACARAPGDGYTACVLGVDALSSNPHTFDRLPYDPDKDFKPVAQLFTVQEALVVNAGLPITSVAELRERAARQPGSLNLGTLGPDSSPDIFLAWLRDRWKVDIAAVPYKGGGPIAAAVLANEIQIGYVGLGNFVGGLQSGRLRALAVGSSRRLSQFADVPTLTEAGLGGYGVRPWWGLLMPADTPDAVVARFNAEVMRLYAEPRFGEFLAARFVESSANTPGEFAAFLKADRERAGQVIAVARASRASTAASPAGGSTR